MDKEFQALFDRLCYGRTPHAVWDDFIFMSAATIANVFDHQQDRVDRYLDIAKKYKPEEMTILKELFARTAMTLEENPHQDYLGQMFMEFNFGNVKMGQYFTPYSIAEMMSMMGVDKERQRHFETVNDPACGSGVMLIAAYNRFVQFGRNPNTELFVVGQDLDFSIALMCYIQLSLLGAAGYVVIGNSLTEPLTGDVLVAPTGAWCTPLYFHKVWHWRRAYRALSELAKEEKQNGTEQGAV